jgi:murein DD-endopeptidase MepM/ murein hydrolase activator NlpD
MPLTAAVLGLALLLPPAGSAAFARTAPGPLSLHSPYLPAAAAIGPVPSVPAARWVRPLSGELRVVRYFLLPPLPWLAGHRGVDLAGSPGDPVRAAAAGVVTFAGTVATREVVSVTHPGGLRTTYEPVTATVVTGDVVAAGAPLGRLDAGHPGCAMPACLHWGLRRGLTYLDPLVLLRPLHVRLKPLTAASRA